jgi:hypothetical protein
VEVGVGGDAVELHCGGIAFALWNRRGTWAPAGESLAGE